MATAYTSLLGLALPVTGELSGAWGTTVNDAITSLLDTAVAGTTSITADADITLTTTTGVANQSRQAIILWNPASGTTTRNITAPAQSKIYTVINASGGTQSIVFRGAGPTTGVTIVKGESAVVAWNGTDFIKISNAGGSASFTNVTVSGTTTLSGLTASTALALDASKNVVSVTNTGTGNNVLSASPTLTGTISGANASLSGTLGVTGVATFTAQPILSSLTASQAVFTDGSKGLVSNAVTGTGNVVMSASPTLTGTITAAAANFSGAVALGDAAADNITVNGTVTSNLIFTDNTYDIGASGATRPRNLFLAGNATVGGNIVLTGSLDLTNLEVTNIKAKDGTAGMQIADSTGVVSFTANPVMSGGTANGVAYLNGSKVLTTGSALTFDGTNFASTGGATFQGGPTGYGGGEVRLGTAASGQQSAISTLSVDSPVLVFDHRGTSNTGVFVWRNGTGGANELARLTSAGLSIGTSSPASFAGTTNLVVGGGSGNPVLTLYGGAATYSGVYFADGASGSDRYRGFFEYNHSTDSLTIGTAASTKATLDSSGNLGLGVTPSAWSAGKAIQVGEVAVSLWGISGNTVLGNNSYFSSGDKYATTSGASQYAQFNGKHIWYTAPSGTAGNAISFTQAMTLAASGGLSIGTTSDAGAKNLLLDAGGKLAGNSPSGGTSSTIELYNSSTGSMNLATGFSSASITFATQSTERARIDSSGNLLVTGVGGLGYGTGSGGAVTQATSRTTGVTLNKTNGAITLVSAAGLATFQSFTVTNSTVAATDVVHVTQKSGTDLYQIFVTATAAGSFQITFATTGGTTTEQPVFNFAVLKAVIA
jgi:hypothetical protein